MSSAPSTPTRLSNKTLFFYSLTELPLMMALFPVMVFIPKYYTTEMGVGLALAGNIILTVRIFDIFTDPLIGVLSDRTRTPWGRRRPWVLASMPLLVAGFYLLFVPLEDLSLLTAMLPAEMATREYTSGLYMFLCMVLLSVGATMIMIPYWSWGAELSPDYNERTRITGWRAAFGVGGSLLAQLLPILAGIFFGLQGDEAVLIVVGTGMLVTMPICMILTVWMVPENKNFVSAYTPLLEGLRLMMKNSPFKKLIMAFASSSTGLTITTPLYAFFIAFVLQDTTSTIYMLSIFYLVNIAAIPIWVRISQNIGKRSCYITAFVIISVVHPFYMLLGPGDIWWMTPVTIMTGFCAGAFNALPNSMKADVIDLDTLESGENRAASYFATWSFTTKIVNAGGAWLALNGLALTGFDPQLGAGNSEEHLMGLRLMFAVIPSAFYLLAVAFIWSYPITEEYHQQVRDELDRRDAVPEPAQ